MSNQRKVAFYTLGCKLNYAETSSISRTFEERGFEKVEFDQPADIYVVNTCSVTDNADKKCRNIIRKALRQSPDARVAVIGCYAQLQPETIAKIPGVSLVLGAEEKFNVIDHLEEHEYGHETAIHVGAINNVEFYADAYSFGDRTRTFLKVQDGCDYSCAFCTIPMARGKSRSPAISSVIGKAEEIAEKGLKEVVLTGVNIGDFGKGTADSKRRKESFFYLLQALDRVKGIDRFRISSIEPNLLTDEIIDFVATSQKFTPHFHIPLQSGSNKILKLMRRRYLRELYIERVAKIKSMMPDCCIGVDVIVGFPGESHDDFLETYHFLNDLEISYLHVFTYSERPNTAAIHFKASVPLKERNKRSKMLRTLSAKKRRFFYEQHLGNCREVLFESNSENGFLCGFTDNYIKVKVPYNPLLINQIKNVQLRQIDLDGKVDAELDPHDYFIAVNGSRS